ncbi:MAG: D-aminoacyl-tRNA deacylase [Thermoanaerobaculia bacterium]
MRIVLQRVSRAAVEVDGRELSRIGHGLLALVCIAQSDDDTVVRRAAHKVAGLRLFEDDAGKMNLDLAGVGGAVLVVSQFTLLADTSRGRRPSFEDAAAGAVAAPLVELFAATLRQSGFAVATGRFAARMRIELVNDGPVTLVLDF